MRSRGAASQIRLEALAGGFSRDPERHHICWEFNGLTSVLRFLTWHNRVSMVRAVSAGGRTAIAKKLASVGSMSDGARENGDSENAHTDEAALSERLKRLGERLARDQAGRPSDEAAEDRATSASGFAKGLRLSSELVAGVLVGAGLGLLIDRTLGSSPWGLIVFLLLGFAAGVLNVMRSAGLTRSGTAENAGGENRNH
jgi:ATP synthase protein I